MGLTNWYYNGVNGFQGETFSRMPGFGALAFVIAVGFVAWFVMGDTFGRTDGTAALLRKKVTVDDWFGFIPFSVFWLIATIVAYTIAGEKMPWLSIHIVIPMAFLVGWYFNELFKEFDLATFILSLIHI